ncbi:MAG: transcriptional regulator [Actinomycetota bacterium]|nr:transcriptional regulator [Actinomycetota bacterium]
MKIESRPLSSAEDGSTRNLIARSILENGPSSASTLAQRLSITPSGVRRHLDRLVADGILSARQPYAGLSRGRGRPSKLFLISEQGHENFKHSYDDLALAALRFMSAEVNENLVHSFAKSRAEDIERKAAPILAESTDKNEALAQFFTEIGYASTIQPRALGDELCQHHCPIAHVATAFPQLCETETEAISHLLGTHVQRLATIAHGDGVCTTFIPTLQTKTNKRKVLA